MDSNKLDGIDIVVRYIIRNPVNSFAHVRGQKYSVSSIENERRMLYSNIWKHIIEHINLLNYDIYIYIYIYIYKYIYYYILYLLNYYTYY